VHQIELPRGAFEIARPDRIGHGLEIAHRLERDDFKAEIGRHLPGVARFAAEEGEIVLENLDGPETRFGGRPQFGFERAAHADGSD
jgi:hypothetical protein